MRSFYAAGAPYAVAELSVTLGVSNAALVILCGFLGGLARRQHRQLEQLRDEHLDLAEQSFSALERRPILHERPLSDIPSDDTPRFDERRQKGEAGDSS
jgi:hypothetical protein